MDDPVTANTKRLRKRSLLELSAEAQTGQQQSSNRKTFPRACRGSTMNSRFRAMRRESNPGYAEPKGYHVDNRPLLQEEELEKVR